jgi:hypothetical protein
MTALLAVVLIVAILAFVVLLDRKDKRADRDRQVLLNRIQAPATGVAQSLELPDAEPVRALPFDDDEAYWAYRAEAS